MTGIIACRLAIAASLTLFVGAASADEVADFYRGKTITMVVSVGEGDGMDKTARLVARHWSDHIPGRPGFIAKNMPGAGNLRATDYLAVQAPRDGTAIAAIIPVFVMQQIIGGKGINYDAAKLAWLGSSNSSNPTFFTWHAAGIKTLAKAKERQVLMGATGAGSNGALYPTLLNNLLGTRFKIILGYRNASEVNLAIERGEVEGRAGETFNTMAANESEWVRDGKLDILAQIGTAPEKGFEAIPLATDLAPDESSRAVLRLFGAEISLGRPYLAPPDVPPDRIAALRDGFDATMRDPALLSDAATQRLDISPTRGVELQALASSMLAANADTIARMKAAVGGAE